MVRNTQALESIRWYLMASERCMALVSDIQQVYQLLVDTLKQSCHANDSNCLNNALFLNSPEGTL